MGTVSIRIGEEIFDLDLDVIRKAINEGMIEGHDLVRSAQLTDDQWKMVGETEPLRSWLVGSSDQSVADKELGLPTLKKALLEKQEQLLEELASKGVDLVCPNCGPEGKTIPSAVYPGKFYCKRCERYYKI